MKEFATTAERYFRKPDTKLAKNIKKISPKVGAAYTENPTKITIDKRLALPAAILATPVYTGLANIKKAVDGGERYYTDPRVGKDDKVIYLKKISTLHTDAHLDTEGNTFNTHNGGKGTDPRSTKMGAWLRKTKLNELPQLWNVAKGEISFFGIRNDNEHTFSHIEEQYGAERTKAYREQITRQRGGLINPVTALAEEGIEERYEKNLLYERKASLGLDLYMLFRLIANKRMEKERQYLESKLIT